MQIINDYTYKVKESYLSYFLKEFWFIPPDVLQRGIEANVWDLCQFNKPILDIGIGNGRMTKFIFRKAPKIDVGIDNDKSGLEEARKANRYEKVMFANAEKMPFKDGFFKTVVSNSTFEHISNDLSAVSEVGRVLMDGGLFYLTVPSEFFPKWILEIDNKEKLMEFNIRADHLHYRPIEEWKRYFKKNNLELIFCKYYFPKKTFTIWYRLFKLFTGKINNRELWFIVGQSRLTGLIPKKIVINILKNIILKNAYKNGFFTDFQGAQLFMVAKKI